MNDMNRDFFHKEVYHGICNFCKKQIDNTENYYLLSQHKNNGNN